ncbi:MAG TPA: cyclic nucleotide-binding domain-containing protein [Vicinamibacteria bacterium]|jgi:CRP-like cAMP-binding protein
MIQQFLKTIPLFREMDDDDLAQVLMAGLVRRFREGAFLLTEGSTGGQLHVIHEGRVRISKVVPGVGEEALAILGPGEFFGEMEFLDGSPASAHAIAHSDCEVLSLPHREIRAMLASRPELAAKFLWAFGMTLAGRLRDANHKLASLFAITKSF